jgi:hypothetical protein
LLADQLIASWQKTGRGAKVDVEISAKPLAGPALADAIRSREYDLALAWEDDGDQPARLMALFDPRTSALAPGGSNYLGVDDSELHALTIGLVNSRRFAVLREGMHNIHGRLYETMPFIPLRQPAVVVAVGPGWNVTVPDPLRPFLTATEWQRGR